MFDLINAFVTALVIVFVLYLGYLALKHDSKSITNKLFFFFTMGLATWELFSFFENWSYGGAPLMFTMLRLDFFSAPYVVLLASLFVFNFPDKNTKLNRWIYILCLPIIFISLLAFSNWVITDFSIYGGGVEFKLGKLFFLYAIVFLAYIVFSFINLFFKYPRISHSERRQTVYILFGFAFTLIITTLVNLFLQNRLPVQWFRITNLVPPVILAISMFWAIAFYNLMNIKLIMRRSLVYFLSFLSILLPAAIWLYFFYILAPGFMNIFYFLILILSLLIFSKLKKQYYKFANEHFFSSLYDVRELIYNLNNSLRSSLDVNRIFQSMAGTLMPSFHCKAVAAVSYSKSLNRWAVLYNNGFTFANKHKFFLDYDEARRIFGHKPLIIDKIEKMTYGQPSPFLVSLESLHIAVIVPINIKDKLTHLLFFGPKESTEEYNKDDLKVLDTVGSEVGIALENALLYQRVKKFNVKLKEEIAKATAKLQEQNEELQKLDKTKDEFVSIVSHQLRTPLTSIRWFSELLSGNKNKNLTAEQQEFIEQISASNKKMIKLVGDLLDLSHIETGRKFTIINKKFLVNDLIEEVLQENVVLITTKKLRILNSLPEKLEIFADRDKIKQVWQNLISNATKYTGQNKEIEIGLKNEPGRLVFFVKDQGVGVPTKQQGRLFEKFFRADNAALQDPEGTGLGLHIAREIIRAQSGDLWFESKEGKGATFYFSLPEKPVEQKIKKTKIKQAS